MYKPSNVCASACTTTSCSFCECKQSTDLTHTNTEKSIYWQTRTSDDVDVNVLHLAPPAAAAAVDAVAGRAHILSFSFIFTTCSPVPKTQEVSQSAAAAAKATATTTTTEASTLRWASRRFCLRLRLVSCSRAAATKTKAKHTWSSSRGKCPLPSSHLIFPSSFWESRQLFWLHALLPGNCYHFCDAYIRVGDDHKVLICFVHKLSPTGVSVCKKPSQLYTTE